MLNYGAKAQLQFNYKANEYELVDYGLDSYSPETTNGVKFSGDKVIGNTGLTYAGSSMLLEDTITYRVFFTAADKNSLPEVKYNDETLINGEKGGYVYYDIKGIKAPELLNNCVLTIGGISFTVNPQNYIYQTLYPVDVRIQKVVENIYGVTGSYEKVSRFGMEKFGAYAGYAQEFLYHAEFI